MVHTDIIQYLSEIDTNVFLYFNGIHSPFWDYFMTSFTGKIIWVPMYASILYILLRNFHWKAVLCYVAAIALIITFADQMCSSIIRPVVARLRPSNPESPIVDMVYIVNNYRGGSYGFPSCHAANSFGLAMYVVFMFRKRWLSIFIIAWALLNCYTRVYLGVHYPGDLLVGGIIGGYIMYIVKRGNYNPVIGIAAVSCVPTTAKVAQKIVSKDNPDSFVLGDALGANISGVITSAIITGIYITIIPYL